ncbi:MAG: hypothetical protein HW421_252 [Ignavibacteria bacterium]|nr:hypothetical protein [Ignavibacteria bacterium]
MQKTVPNRTLMDTKENLKMNQFEKQIHPMTGSHRMNEVSKIINN